MPIGPLLIGRGVPIGLIGAGDAAFFFFFFFFLQPPGFDLHGFGVGEASGWAAPGAAGTGVADVICPSAAPVARETPSAKKENARKNFIIAIEPPLGL